jgi:putative acetyltransferase
MASTSTSSNMQSQKRNDHSPGIQVRLANKNEAATIAAILSQAFVEYEPLYTPQGYAATTPNVDQILGRWSEGPVWVALKEDAIIGTIAAVPKGDGLYIRSTAILPDARGSGIGKLLLENVERFAIQNHAKRMFLSTTPFLFRAIQLYEKFGFRKTNEGPLDLEGTPLFTMEKKLQPQRP